MMACRGIARIAIVVLMLQASVVSDGSALHRLDPNGGWQEVPDTRNGRSVCAASSTHRGGDTSVGSAMRPTASTRSGDCCRSSTGSLWPYREAATPQH